MQNQLEVWERRGTKNEMDIPEFRWHQCSVGREDQCRISCVGERFSHRGQRRGPFPLIVVATSVTNVHGGTYVKGRVRCW